MNIKYVGPARDFSGYGEANRHDIAALDAAFVGVTAKIPRYTPDLADFGKLQKLMDTVENRDLPYDIIILHTTPNVYKQYMEEGKYHIARVFWETDKLPEDFAKNVQLCDEVWTGSEYNKQAIIKAGVTKPIYIIPEALDTSLDITTIKPYLTKTQDTYRFYSIFEWTERKNPAALLEAYWKTFEGKEDVSLTLKTYVDNFSKEKKEEIDQTIRSIKRRLDLTSYAPIYLYRHLMDRAQIYRFHKSFDCFVSTHRGEGWGIPQMEALLCGNPIISTNCGGIHEYLTDGKDAILLPYTLTPVQGNSRNQQWYCSDQQWAEVDTEALSNAMMDAYTKREQFAEMGKEGSNTVQVCFSLEHVGNKMLERLEQIRSN